MEDEMSAAVAWDVAPLQAGMPGRPARPHLTSVPCGDAVVEPRRSVRLTRAGRLAITLTVLAAAVALAVTLFTGGASAMTIDHSTTVQPGQTLSEVAATQLPGVPVADAVAQIQLANDLPSDQVHAGQTLLIPAVR
jgi:LysM repeat protein